MTTSGLTVIRSRDNALLKDLRRLAQDATAWRKQGRVWLEGDHLARAAQARGQTAAMVLFSESYWPLAGALQRFPATKIIVVDDALWAGLSGLESPAPMAVVLDLPPAPTLDANAPTVVLDRLQDAGNVGAILRSAAAFGFRQVVALKGTAGLWSPKVVRAGMGAHFALSLLDAADPSVLDALKVPLLATSSHHGEWLHRAALPWPCAWLMGHEGQGVDPTLEARAALSVRIVQPGGEESLNVASAAAICLHASAAAQAG